MSLCLQHKPRHKKHANKNTSLGEEIAWCVLATVLEHSCLFLGAGKGQPWCEAALLMAARLAPLWAGHAAGNVFLVMEACRKEPAQLSCYVFLCW